ncbi:MAG: hypothetical protein V1746_02415 [bacterium]
MATQDLKPILETSAFFLEGAKFSCSLCGNLATQRKLYDRINKTQEPDSALVGELAAYYQKSKEQRSHAPSSMPSFIHSTPFYPESVAQNPGDSSRAY